MSLPGGLQFRGCDGNFDQNLDNVNLPHGLQQFTSGLSAFSSSFICSDASVFLSENEEFGDGV